MQAISPTRAPFPASAAGDVAVCPSAPENGADGAPETGEVMPAEVSRVVDFLTCHGVWHVLTRNSPATGCRDAAARRWRLGRQGIPLYDELKTLCMAAYLPEGRRHVLLHTRANARLDLEAAGHLMGALRPLARLSADELRAAYGIGYGTVNPFTFPNRFIHVFDNDVLVPYTAPHTMMTNAGDPTWAVEFEPATLIGALREAGADVRLGDIDNRSRSGRRLPSFGIITGNGPESGMALWRHLNATVFRQLSGDGRLHGDLSYPRVLVFSLPEMGLSMELAQREDQVWRVIEAGVMQLCDADISHLALACNTTPYFTARIRELCEPRGVTFVPIHEPAIRYIRDRRLDDLSILGIPVVAELGRFSAYRELAGMNVRQVEPHALQALQELGYLVKRIGTRGQDVKAMNKLRYVLRAGVKTRRVLIALTEISVLLERYPGFAKRLKGLEIIDPLEIYGALLGDIYLHALPDENADDEDSWLENPVE